MAAKGHTPVYLHLEAFAHASLLLWRRELLLYEDSEKQSTTSPRDETEQTEEERRTVCCIHKTRDTKHNNRQHQQERTAKRGRTREREREREREGERAREQIQRRNGLWSSADQIRLRLIDQFTAHSSQQQYEHLHPGMDEGNRNRGRFVPSSAVQLASLFHADEDYSSDSDQERAFSPLRPPRDDLPGGGRAQGIDSSSPASQAANILSAAAALRGSFPSPPLRGQGAKEDDEELAQPARAASGARNKHIAGGVLAGPPPNSASGSPIDSPGTGSARKESSPISSRRSNNNNASNHVCGNSKTSSSSRKVNTQSDGKDRDIEAARRTRETSRAISVAAREFEVRHGWSFVYSYRLATSTTAVHMMAYEYS